MEQNKKIGAGVGVFILKDNKVLLGKRHDDPEKADSELHGAGTWTMPGGKLHFGETFEQAAIREVEEEIGIVISPEKLELISIANDRVEDAHFITIGFLLHEFEGEPKIMEPEEITEWQWFDLNNLPEKVFFPSAEILKNYLAKKVYQP